MKMIDIILERAGIINLLIILHQFKNLDKLLEVNEDECNQDDFSFSSSVGGATYNVFAVPIESPSHGDRSLEVDPHNTVASPFGWHDINGDSNNEYTITLLIIAVIIIIIEKLFE